MNKKLEKGDAFHIGGLTMCEVLEIHGGRMVARCYTAKFGGVVEQEKRLFTRGDLTGKYTYHGPANKVIRDFTNRYRS